MAFKPPVRILHILTRLPVGGTTVYVLQISHALNNNGFQSFILAGRIEPTETDMSYLAADFGIKPYFINTMSRNVNPWMDLLSVIDIIKIIRRIKPDVVFTHNAKAGVVGRISARLMKIPVIIHTYHGNNFSGYFGKLMSMFSIITERLLARISTCLISISPQQVDDLMFYKIAPLNKIRMIPLGFDLTQIIHSHTDVGVFRKQYQIPSDIKIIAFVGRLAPIKNPYYFLDIASEVLKLRKNVQFLIVGDGELRNELQDSILSKNLQEHVKITGFIRDLKPLYADMDILLLTSRREGTPVSIIEAMANKVIVISTQVGGVENLIDNELNGYLYGLDNARDFSQRIISILDNPEQFRFIGENAQQKIKKEYDLSVLTQNIKNLLNEFSPD